MIPVQHSDDGCTPAARGLALSKVYGVGDTEVRALDGVDVVFPRGQLTAIMGPSGSGKSTLMHLAGQAEFAEEQRSQIEQLLLINALLVLSVIIAVPASCTRWRCRSSSAPARSACSGPWGCRGRSCRGWCASSRSSSRSTARRWASCSARPSASA